MTDVRAIREALAEFRPDGWQRYSTIPGAATLPALVVGLPERIDFDGTYANARLSLSLTLTVGAAFDEREHTLIDAALDVAQRLFDLGPQEHWRALRVLAITDFFVIDVGGSDSLACSIPLEILTN